MPSREDRVRLLSDLTGCVVPIARTERALSLFPWDVEEPLVVLTAAQCASALDRLLRGELSRADIEEWANALEVRDDVEFESGTVGDVIYRLANPVLEGPITSSVAAELLRRCDDTA